MNLNSSQLQKVVEDISGYCTRCPMPAMRSAIENVVEDFCKSVGGVRQHLGPISASPSVHVGGRYFAAAPFGGVIHNVESVELNDRVLALHEYDVSYEEDGRAVIRLRSNPEGLLAFNIAWRPTRRTTQMPEGWFNNHFSAICHGSISHILAQVGTAWENIQLATHFHEEYSRDVNDAIYAARASQNNGGRLNCFDKGATWL